MIDRRMGRILAMAGLLVAGALVPSVHAQRVSRVQDTKHNLSTTGPGTVKASSGETEICVFCHTPHGAEDQGATEANPTTSNNPQLRAPLWNKTLGTTKTYTPYTSSSLDAQIIRGSSLEQPLGSSKLCLSCHDGAMALGTVRVLRGAANQTIALSGTDATKMPAGTGATTGYTRQLGGNVSGQYDLTNDHPISLTYNAALVTRDGELRTPGADTLTNPLNLHPIVGTRSGGQGSGLGNLSSAASTRPVLPLEPTGPSGAGQIQCTTCHDPHIKETNLTNEGNIKFLRRHRVQLSQPGPGNTYDDSKDIMCLACHDKGKQGPGGNSWAYSAHANSQVATQQYKAEAAALRDFPAGLPVWKASCLNCHDTHTVTGSRRLLREGVSGGGDTDNYGTGAFRSGGTPALEETCYQCHRDAAQSALSLTTNVPNIRSDFQLTYHMPITSAEQGSGAEERHDVGGNFSGEGFGGADCSAGTKCGADMIESRAKLGTTAGNRHAECSDCHNPHRVVKFKYFFGNSSGNITTAPDASGTHTHSNSNMVHTNVASGVLRGGWGVEPTYGNQSFHTAPSNYTIRRGDPGEGAPITIPNTVATALTNANIDTKSYVTREYQVCLKCHSSYGQNYTIGASGGDGTPLLTGAPRTPIGTNYLRYYTDQAREFQSPDGHRAVPVNMGHNGGAHNDGAAYPPTNTSANPPAAGNAFNSHNFNANNHRSWHPVMRSTGRTRSLRAMGAANYPWYKPWSHSGPPDPVGTQTMFCSDCHGSNAGTTGVRGQDNVGTAGGSVIPGASGAPVEDGPPWGPHGSTNPFILKGVWNENRIGTAGPPQDNVLCFKCHDPAFYTGEAEVAGSGFCCDGKTNLHQYHDKVITGSQLVCSWCHVAVPHGWKNKAFLVNLNDVGLEVGYSGTPKEVSMNANGDYYNKGPYYMKAKLKVRNFAASGSWTMDSCNSAGKGTNHRIDGSGGSANRIGGGGGKEDDGREWMRSVCSNPP